MTYKLSQPTWNKLTACLDKPTNDCFAIEEAMKYAATRTRQTNRGKGLADFKKPIDKIKGAKLHVLSNHGSYLYRNGSKERKIEGLGMDSRESLCGTLIDWVIPAKDLERL